ncbi:rhodanese-like domain-containing protein [Phytoactinopolyspora halotolerans]|nr:rhodanese-like domain-containing protein [Phytoactinopolyspora halotolerans]
MDVPEVDVSAVPDDAALLDVREHPEWEAGHAPHAVHVPMSELPSRLGELPESGRVYVVCKVGGRSWQVAAWLNEMGRDAVNVAGGMASWAAAGRPMVSDAGDPYVA